MLICNSFCTSDEGSGGNDVPVLSITSADKPAVIGRGFTSIEPSFGFCRYNRCDETA